MSTKARYRQCVFREGSKRLKESGFPHVAVMGDPAYYGRFGFKWENVVKPLYDLPAEWKTAQ